MSAAVPRSLTAAVTALCRALRAHGVPATPGDSVDAVRALEVVDVGDREEVRLALRAQLVTRPEDGPVFDTEFDRVFTAADAPPPNAAPNRGLPAPQVRADTRPAVSALEDWLRPTGNEAADPWAALRQPSARDATTGRDLRAFDAGDLDAVTRIARRLARRLATQPSRRWKAAAHGQRVHLRRTMRRLIETGGTPAALVFRDRRPRRTTLLVLCDVSGSMELYARFLLQVVYALQRSFARVETFVFATRLSRVTRSLREPRYRDALDALARGVRDFSGGTRIGASVAELERRWRARIDRRTTVLILSDGWETGDPLVLGDALRRLRRRAARVIWLNPLHGSPGYEPRTRGLVAALPYVDLFHPLHDVASLDALVRHLAP